MKSEENATEESEAFFFCRLVLTLTPSNLFAARINNRAEARY